MFPFGTRQREEVFILINTSDMEDRSHSFILFNWYNFPTTEAADYLSVGTWPNSGHSFGKPIMLNKMLGFFCLVFFVSFPRSPLAHGGEIAIRPQSSIRYGCRGTAMEALS